MPGRELRLAHGPFDLAVTLVKEKGSDRGKEQSDNESDELDQAVPAERIGVSAINAAIGLSVGKSACFTLWHREGSTKTCQTRG